MAIKFTPEQQKVIELRDRNILVSAAAGSGKTAVLVERIIRRITDKENPVDIDRLLIVTFTNAAAAEMRERISQAIDRQLEAEPGSIHLQKQASLLHNAQITTIDSFCLFVIRNNFNEIGLDPGFRVADEGEMRLLTQDVMRDFLEEQYQEKNPAFADCVEYFTGGSNDKLLEEYIAKLYEFSMSCPWPEEWLLQRKEDYRIADIGALEAAPWVQYLLSYMGTVLEECKSSLETAVKVAERPDGPYMYGPVLESEIKMLNRVLSSKSFGEYYEAFETIAFGRLPSKKDDSVNPLCREKVQKLRNGVKKQLEELREMALRLSPAQVLERMQKASPFVETLLELVLSYKKELDAKKRRENIIDFYDMEHFALNILLKKTESGEAVPSSAALEYRQFFEEILIDEYQDSNMVQELLLKSISGEDAERYNRFMVGDVKQSIYKFRLARPELFMEKYACYSKEDSKCQRIDLHKNFRSRPQVLDSVNDLFSQIMGQRLGGVEYDEEAALYPGADYPEGEEENLEKKTSPYETEYLIIGKEEDSSLTVREQEAAVIARRIKELYRTLQVTDKESGRLRPVRYGDIVILLRTNAGWAEEFKKALEREGIPAYMSSQTGYFQAVEIKALLQFLRVIDNPLQDIPLYGTLKSFFGGFSQEEIALIRGESGDSKGKKSHGKLLLYESLMAHEGILKEKIKAFLDKVNRYRRKTAYTPVHKLIQEILWDSGYLNYVLACPGGEQRRANVEMLLTRASAFENTSYYGLFHFLRYIEQLEKYEVDYGMADVLDENADVVRIMSIHKSKGLEFPVCFVAGLSKKFNMQDVGGRLIADVDMGIGADYIDSILRVQSRTLKKNAVALKMKLDALGEEMRVLYVAMTRAKEKLILTGVVNDLEKFAAAMEEKREFEKEESRKGGKVSFSVLAGANSCLDFILPCLKKAVLVKPEEILQGDIEDEAAAMGRRQKLFQKEVEGNILTESDNAIMAQLSERFARTYRYQYLSGLFVKTTVSELKKKAMHDIPEQSTEILEGDSGGGGRLEKAFTGVLFEEPEIVPYIPSFIRQEEEQMSGADRGSAYHKAMELLDFKKVLAAGGRLQMKEEISRQPDLFAREELLEERQRMKEEIARQLDLFTREELLEERQRKSISPAKLIPFFESGLAGRMCRAQGSGKLFKEQPFVLGLSADRLGEQFPDSEQVLIQGIIDVFFEEEGKIVVADYKTDSVKEPEELIRRYQVQLDYYTEALERLTGKEVAEKIIYSFALDREVMVY
ncbi:MAG: helicase-exonuclease AddAB subunit AddA [Clostridium sp.]|nr:helicase-exonuclease AddAB subunit AddA [Clostridium sp.]